MEDEKVNITFSGCGFLGIYHVGVLSCFKLHAPKFSDSVRYYGGASAGALAAVSSLSDISVEESVLFVMRLAGKALTKPFGPLSPSFEPVKIIKRQFMKNLPVNAYKIASGKLHISLTRVSDWKNVIVSEYSSNEELVNALICTSFVPFYSGIVPPKFKGVAYVDGGFTDNLPQHFSGTTITVSPFSGESDICPDDSNESQTHFDLRNTSVKFTSQNLYRMSRAFFPPAPDVLSDMCRQGFRDALKYLHMHYPEMLNIGIARIHIPECCVDSESEEDSASACSCTTATSRLTDVESTIAARNTILDTVVPHRLNEILQGTKELIVECDLMTWYMIKVFLRIVKWLARPCIYTIHHLGCFATEIVQWLIPKIKEISSQNYYTSILVNIALEVFYTYGNLHQCERHPSLKDQDLTDMAEAKAKILEAQRRMRAVPLENREDTEKVTRRDEEKATRKEPVRMKSHQEESANLARRKVKPPNMEYLGLSPRRTPRRNLDGEPHREDGLKNTLKRQLSSDNEFARKSYSCQDFLDIELQRSYLVSQDRRDSFDQFVYSFVDSEDDGVFSDSSMSGCVASTPHKRLEGDND